MLYDRHTKLGETARWQTDIKAGSKSFVTVSWTDTVPGRMVKWKK